MVDWKRIRTDEEYCQRYYETLYKGFKPISDDEGTQYEYPVVRFEKVRKCVIEPAFVRLGAIPKKDLVVGAHYKGYCRNASEAVWTGDKFVYTRHKFGSEFKEYIPHFEDDDGYYDVFVPYQTI